MADRVRMNTLSLSTTALAQTPSFWHAGADLLRSKSLARDSYNSGDWFNRLDWTGVDNGFGHGLPPGGDLPYQKGLLGNAALKPSATDVATASAAAQDLLKLRFSTPLFRLGSADLINAKVGFPVSGTPDAHPGVVVMRIDDTVGPNVDPALKGVLVVVNASPTAVTQKVPALAGSALALLSRAGLRQRPGRQGHHVGCGHRHGDGPGAGRWRCSSSGDLRVVCEPDGLAYPVALDGEDHLDDVVLRDVLCGPDPVLERDEVAAVLGEERRRPGRTADPDRHRDDAPAVADVAGRHAEVLAQRLRDGDEVVGRRTAPLDDLGLELEQHLSRPAPRGTP